MESTKQDKILTLDRILQEPYFKGTSNDVYFERIAQSLAGRDSVSGAELMVICEESLAPENPGINVSAGHHGGAILPYYEFFTKSRLFERYSHVPHEQIAGHMAEGVAYFGYVGVAKATSGPGATNLVTAIFDAYMDSKAVVFITGNVSQKVRGSMAFQEAEITEMVKPHSKRVYYVEDARAIPKILYEAFYVAPSGRPGPVLIDIPKDVQLAQIKPSEIDRNFAVPGFLDGNKYSAEEALELFERLAEMINDSKRPLLYIGAGAREAWRELRRFAYQTGIPVTSTLKGKGVFPENSPLSLGMLGMHGTAYANKCTELTDLLIAVGARFDDRVTGDPIAFSSQARIADINIDPRGICPNGVRQPDLTIKLDAKKSLRILNLLGMPTGNLAEWHSEIEDLKAKFPLEYDGRSELFKPKPLTSRIADSLKIMPPLSRFAGNKPIKPQYIIEKIFQLTKGEYIVFADVGQHQMWAAQYYLAKSPSQFDTSGGSGTMGYSMPAAFGINNILKYLGDDRKIAVIVGDESFMMVPQTLDLYARTKAGIKVFVINNKAPDGTPGGMVSQWYRIVHQNTSHPVKDSRDIAKIAQGFGVPSENVLYANKVESSIRRALNTNGPYLVSFKVDPYEDCLPMIPGGGRVRDMITYQDKKKEG